MTTTQYANQLEAGLRTAEARVPSIMLPPCPYAPVTARVPSGAYLPIYLHLSFVEQNPPIYRLKAPIRVVIEQKCGDALDPG